MSKPENGPLGATPILPAPAPGKPSEKAAGLFARYLSDLKETRAPKQGRQLEQAKGGGPGTPASPPRRERERERERQREQEPRTGARSYGLALAVAYDAAPTTEAQEEASAFPAEEPTRVTIAPPGRAGFADADNSVAEPAGPPAAPSRPPPGAPTVRPPARRREEGTALSKADLEGAAQGLQVIANPDGSTAFEISISDELFQDLTCRVTWRDGRLLATFRVADTNLRRLLEAEAGRLRARLEERGLKVEEVVVLSDSSPDP